MKLAFITRALLGVVLTTGAALAQTSPTKDLIKINIGGPSAGYFMTYVAYDLSLIHI